MSRIGKKPISVPQGVEITLSESLPHKVFVKGKLGSLERIFHPKIHIKRQGEELCIGVDHEEEKQARSLWGLSRTLLANMIQGVTEGFKKQLEVVGVGYKVAALTDKVVLNVGYSHPVEIVLPEGITASVEKNVLTISGIDKELVGEISANIRRVRKPEPYKGKGIKYMDEIIRRKAGKTAKT